MDSKAMAEILYTTRLRILGNIFGFIFLIVGSVQLSDYKSPDAGKLRRRDRFFKIFCLTIGLAICIHVQSMHWPDPTDIFQDPFCWAILAMFALIGASDTLVSNQLGRYPNLNISLVGLFAFCRFILVLPIVHQPRFVIETWHTALGSTLFLAGLLFLTPLLQIAPFPAPGKPKQLITTGFYSIVRNPIYLGEILWSLGWAILFGSVIGIALVPFWWGGLLFLTFLEEEDLERKLGDRYLVYKKQVTGRIFPGLPI